MNFQGLKQRQFKISYNPSDDRLREFYIPALSTSISYDRSTGYFSSASLAIAAAGIAELIKNQGKMRLMVGAQLNPDDIAAIQKGYDLKEKLSQRLLEALPDPEDMLLKQRLSVLAWLVATGKLEIKVVLKTDNKGNPIPAPQSQDYYHPKEGIFTDVCGDRIAFSGSINESIDGWQHNYEVFYVYHSWDSSNIYLEEAVSRFARLWKGKEIGWIAVDIPEAVRQRLLKFCPSKAPEFDSLITLQEEKELTGDEKKEGLLFSFIRDAPLMPVSSHLGFATSAILPWPHQLRVAEKLVETFPHRYLLCDEVGLGKTIEAGLVLRQLILSGRVKRCLILVPKSILKQWQQELYEKMVLNLPRYEDGKFRDVFDNVLPLSGNNPWSAFPVFLASSQLAKMKDNHQAILSCEPWDLVLLDEAHHARRREFLGERYRENRLLELFSALIGKTKGLLLLTATPMQIHPVEVWDLLKLLGLGGKWGAEEDNFQRFFAQLKLSYDNVDWEFILDMVKDSLETGTKPDEIIGKEAEKRVGIVEWYILKNLPFSTDKKGSLKKLSSAGCALLYEFARRTSPLRHFLVRNTRKLLHEYRARGILKEKVPTREPKPIWIEMSDEEEELYKRIEEYITTFYKRYEEKRKGLGFVMTVYRRRLTSSFYAVRESLKKRLKFLKGEANFEEILDNDDTEQEDLNKDITEEMEEIPDIFREEIAYVEDFIGDLSKIGKDPKVVQLENDLNSLLKLRETVLVFTLYTDTMDYLKDVLVPVYGRQVGCYSGKGGERWNGTEWLKVTKDEMKKAFASKEIKVMLCTEAASEGLNLQTCGIIINYDMPWNPMRVEQRIGRIDRISQVYDVVWIRNYFYDVDIEADIYRALENRIDWFQSVIGELQPILGEVARSIEKLAMTPLAEREARLQEELKQLLQEIDSKEKLSFKLEDYQEKEVVPEPPEDSIVTLDEIKDLLTTSSYTANHFKGHPDLPGAYNLKWHDENITVTFEPKLFDEKPYSVRFLTYGESLLSAILQSVPLLPHSENSKGILRLESKELLTMVVYYIIENGIPKMIKSFSALKEFLEENKEELLWTEPLIARAREDFLSNLMQYHNDQKAIETSFTKAQRMAMEEAGRQILTKAALLEQALSGNLPDAEQGFTPGVMENALNSLKYRGYPFSALIRMLGIKVPDNYIIYQYLLELQGLSVESIRGKMEALKREAEELVKKLAVCRKESIETTKKPVIMEGIFDI